MTLKTVSDIDDLAIVLYTGITIIISTDVIISLLVFGPKNLELFTTNNTKGGHNSGI